MLTDLPIPGDGGAATELCVKVKVLATVANPVR
jgi:hypothetical protein